MAPEITAYIRTYLTTPLAHFDFEYVSEDSVPVPLAAAAKCLAVCIRVSGDAIFVRKVTKASQLTPGEGVLLSNTYSLLNLMAASSLEPPINPTAQALQHQQLEENEATHSLATGLLDSQNEGHRGLLAITTIAVVASLALEFNAEEVMPTHVCHSYMTHFLKVTRLTVSMLIQRLRTAEPMVEAAITYHLVNLVLIAPKSAVGDIIRAFSALHRATNRVDPSFSHNTVS